MPIYRDPFTKEEINDPSGGLRTFYIWHGFEIVDEGPEPKEVKPHNPEGNPPADLADLVADISGPTKKPKGL